MNKFTPGPWRASFFVRNQRTKTGDWVFFSSDPIHTAPLLRNGHRSAADARLIAAAPELLAALQHVVKDLEAIADNTNDGRVPLLARMSAHNARAAIAKATGEA